jgi:uncharacterized membrane protein (UPF0127 family)
MMVGGLRIRVARTFRQRLLGVRAWDDWHTRSWALWLPRCRAVHTLGLGQAIDVVFVSRTGAPVCVVPRLAPRRICVCPQAWGVLELPAGYCSSPGWSAVLSGAWGALKIVV